MATYREAKCRLCRREGEKLFLKGSRCFTEKCAFERRGYAPGEHGKDRRPKETSYGVQLRDEAEDAPDLRRAGSAVPELLRTRPSIRRA